MLFVFQNSCYDSKYFDNGFIAPALINSLVYSTAHKIFQMLTTFRICLHYNAVSNTTNLDEAISKLPYPGIRKLAGIQSPLVVTCGKLPGE